MTVSEQKFPGGALAEVVINDVDWADATVEANINEMATRLGTTRTLSLDQYYPSGRILLRGRHHKQSALQHSTQSYEFISCFESLFVNDVKFNSASEIESIRMHMRHFSSSEATTLMDSLANARDIIDSYGYDAYPYAIEYHVGVILHHAN